MTNTCWVVRDYNGHIKLFSNFKDASEEFKSTKHIWQAVFQEEIHMSDYEVHLDMPIGAPTTTDDPVTHPSHYTFGNYEVIDVINDWKLNFNRGNAIKYIARAGKKNPDKEIEDLEKAVFYLQDEIKRLRND